MCKEDKDDSAPSKINTEKFLHIISQKTARSLGLPRFFNGKKCKRGMIAERRTHNSLCICKLCMRARADRNNDYKGENREKIRTSSAEYSERNKHKIRQYHDKYMADPINRHKRLLYNRERYERLKDELTKYYRAWYVENIHSIKEKAKEYRSRTSSIVKARSRTAKRRADLSDRTPIWYSEYDKFVMHECYSLCRDRKIATGIDWHVDHMYPLRGKTVSGLHCAENMQVIPAFLNIYKQNKLLFVERDEYLSYLEF